MRWRDIRFEKPTESDGDCHGEIAAVLYDGRKVSMLWDSSDVEGMSHFWCPMSELPAPPERIPDPPEGWRFVQKGDVFDYRVKYWSRFEKAWKPTAQKSEYIWRFAYIVPIDPSKPKYRPYTEAEAVDLIGKVVHGIAGYRAMITGVSFDKVYCQGKVIPLDRLLSEHRFIDGSECGVEVAE
jgi:hypothetical protein